MADDSQDDKTEQATDSRREEFRKRGQVASTKELGTALAFLAAGGLLYVLARFFFANISEVFEVTFGVSMLKFVKAGEYSDLLWFVGKKLVLLISPVMFGTLAIGVASNLVQTGFLQVEDALSFNLGRLNPMSAVGRIFSMKGIGELVKNMLKMVIVCWTMYLLLKSELHQIPYLSNYSIPELFAYLGRIVFKLLMGTGTFMLVLAVADYFFQRWQLEKEMMMSKQEIKEEHKSREGDPMIKARIRKIQREISQRKMMQNIPKADVIITNPTHIAVALRYSDKLPAPQLIGKGADFMAEKIKELAKLHNIPVIENKPLARTIFKTMKVGQVIPRELFVAVAEILSYVMRLKRKRKARRTTGTAQRPQTQRPTNQNNNGPMA
ncbi:flagellar biosynthesis protein FlhB [Bdellovibrio sp. qaytius]|nr:flagellar biosynthesis protein FlhB [Bdellovibrio sp. qaytius]